MALVVMSQLLYVIPLVKTTRTKHLEGRPPPRACLTSKPVIFPLKMLPPQISNLNPTSAGFSANGQGSSLLLLVTIP